MNFLFTLSLKVWPFWIPHLNEPQIDRKPIKIENNLKDYHLSWLISVFYFIFKFKMISLEVRPTRNWPFNQFAMKLRAQLCSSLKKCGIVGN